jgi:hypothetical protein
LRAVEELEGGGVVLISEVVSVCGLPIFQDSRTSIAFEA